MPSHLNFLSLNAYALILVGFHVALRFPASNRNTHKRLIVVYIGQVQAYGQD